MKKARPRLSPAIFAMLVLCAWADLAMVDDIEVTSRKGVNAVEALFLELGWQFREQPVADNGIDAFVEVKEDGRPTGKLLALQIKSGTSYFRKKVGSAYIFRGDLKHLNYWTRGYVLPVFLILHNPETRETIWQRVERRLCNMAKKSWSIPVPETNKIDRASMYSLARGLVNDEEAYLRYVFTIDAEFMARFEDHDATMTWEVWVNKHLGLRNPAFEFGDGDRVEFTSWYLGHDIHEAMARLYPWLEYHDMDEMEEIAGEYEIHKFEVQLRPEARAFLLTERFFKQGIVQQDLFDEDSLGDVELSEEESSEYWPSFTDDE